MFRKNCGGAGALKTQQGYTALFFLQLDYRETRKRYMFSDAKAQRCEVLLSHTSRLLNTDTCMVGHSRGSLKSNRLG